MIKIEAPERLKILKKGAIYQMQRSFRLILGNREPCLHRTTTAFKSSGVNHPCLNRTNRTATLLQHTVITRMEIVTFLVLSVSDRF